MNESFTPKKTLGAALTRSRLCLCVCVCVWYPLSMHACLLRVAVTIGGVNLADSPFEIHVKAGKTSACTSHAEGSGWQRQRVLVGDRLSTAVHHRRLHAQGNRAEPAHGRIRRDSYRVLARRLLHPAPPDVPRLTSRQV